MWKIKTCIMQHVLKQTCGKFPRFLHTRVSLKLMPPILLCWPMTSEADVGDMAVDFEPSRLYSIKFCCHVKDDSRGAV
jgi:hypothetical protein